MQRTYERPITGSVIAASVFRSHNEVRLADSVVLVLMVSLIPLTFRIPPLWTSVQPCLGPAHDYLSNGFTRGEVYNERGSHLARSSK